MVYRTLIKLTLAFIAGFGIHEFWKEHSMAKCFISFDFDNDKQYRYLLTAWSKHQRFERISFRDGTANEIQSNDISRIKAALTKKIRDATHLVVVIGKYANTRHRDCALIGEINWQQWEVKQALLANKRIVGIKTDSTNLTPSILKGQNVTWAMSFTEASISNAFTKAGM